ncbi:MULTISPECIES: hypothetical protein [unclassified Sphingomonas]|uniref:hypothetical protein n=1 Tax=unclassified Sphingomonas TaxID=196159 RepID=UPI000AD94473|nr:MULTISPECIES: hypothetical protein [unclassified Sphingomonas]
MDKSLPPSTPLAAADRMWPFTLTHFVLIGLFALVALYIIWRGRRLKQRRREAEAELLESGHGFRLDAGSPDIEDQPAPVAPIPQEAPAPQLQAAPVPSQNPEPQLQAEPPPASPAAASDLTILKGVGPRVAARLAEEGVTSLAVLAALTPERAATIDAALGNFAGRMARDKWVEQARLIVAGDVSEYERQFGALDRGRPAQSG